MMPSLLPRLLTTFARSSRTLSSSVSSGRACGLLSSFSSPNNNNNNVTYQLPDHIKPFTGVVGDQKLKRLPLLDGAKKDNNFAILQSINSSMTVFYPKPSIPSTFELDLSISGIMSSILQQQQNGLGKQQGYELPTADGQAKEKLADYYKHRDPKRFTHLLWVRHRKMKKHQRLKWRKKNLAMIKRRLLERNIAKEKHFRAELLAQVREAENFNAEEYVAKILHTVDNVPKAETPQQKYERYQDLRRKNRTQTNLVFPKFED